MQNGGTCATPSATYTGGDALILPAAEFTDKLFDGWYDSEDYLIGKAGAEYTPTDNIELFAHYSYENKLKKAVFSNGFDAFINEDAKIVNVYYLDGSAEPTLTTGTASLASCTVTETDGKLVVTAPDDSFVEYILNKTAVTPVAVGEYTFDGSEDWVKAPYGFDVENNRGWKYSKNADDGRVEKGNNRQYYFVAACEKLVLHTASGITSDRNIFVYVNNVKVDAITKAPKYNAAGSYIEIPCNGSAAMVAVVSNQTSGDGGFGKADVVAHEVSTDATLSALSVAGNTIAPAFDAATYNYTCELPYGTAAVPAVSYTLNDANASAVKTDATSVTGATTIVVTAEDGTTQLTYTIQFSVGVASTDATLASLKQGGVAIALVAEQYTYNVNLPYGTAAVPALTAEVNEEHATAVVTDAADFDAEGLATSTVVVTAQDGTTELTYTVKFAKALYPSVVIFDGSTMSNMVAAQDATTGLSWAVVGSTMTAGDKNATYQGTSYTRSLNAGNSSATKHFTITIPKNKQGRIHFLIMTNSSSSTRSAWLTASSDKGAMGDAIVSATSSSYTNLGDATSGWLEEDTYYLHTDNTVNFFVISVEVKSVYPKCEAPVITTQPETNKQFGAGAMTATVVASVEDGGELSYQWYNEADEAVAGATAATLSTETEGKYYVVITNTLADHRDNSTKSDVIELAHRVLNDATLSALTYGSPATVIALVADQYEYNVQLARGTVDVPALTATTNSNYASKVINNAAAFVSYAATSTVVVTAEDGVATQTYTVNFTVKHDLPQTIVSEATTWDWADVATSQIKLVEDKNTELVMANVDGVRNDATFNSQAIVFYGENVYNKESEIAYASIGHISFKTSVDGYVRVTFADNGNNNRRVKIGDVLSESSSSKTDVKTVLAPVVAGEDVVIMGVKADGTGTNQYVRIIKVEFMLYSEVVRSGLEVGRMYTYCPAQNVAKNFMTGAEFFVPENFDGFYVNLMQVNTLTAGHGYIMIPTASTVYAVFNGEVLTEAVEASAATHGMQGFLSADPSAIQDIEDSEDNIVVINNHLHYAGGNYMGVGRAYIRLDIVRELTAEPENPAPRRRIGFDSTVATDINALDQNAEAQKVLMDGVLYIIRAGKTYTPAGQLVK